MKLFIAIMLVCVLNLFGSSLMALNNEIDSLLKLIPNLNKLKEDTNKVNLLYNLSFNHYRLNPQKGIEFGNMGFDLAKKLHWKKGIAKCLNALGTNNTVLCNFDVGLNYYMKSLKYFEELKDDAGIARNLGNIGLLYMSRGLFDKALDYEFKALQKYEQLGDKEGMGRNLGNIGNIYNSQNLYEKALEYDLKSLKINKELNDKVGIAVNLGNIGNIYNQTGNFSKALDYYLKSLKVYKEIGDKSGIARILSNIGNNNKNIGNFDKALDYFKQSLKLSEELGDKRGVVFNLNSLSLLNREIGERQDSVQSNLMDKKHKLIFNSTENYQKAVMYGLEAEKIANDINLGEILYDIYRTISTAYEKLGNSKEALTYFKKYQLAKDSLFSSQTQEKITALEIQYKKEKEIREAEMFAMKEAKQKSYRNSLQYSGIAILLIIMSTIMFIIRKYKIKPGVIEGLVFITFLLFFEFITVLIEPWADDFTGQIPLYKLSINIAVALLFIPFHNFEQKLRLRFAEKKD